METGYLAATKIVSEASSGRNQRRNQSLCRGRSGGGHPGRDPLRRRQNGLAHLGRGTAAGPVPWRLRVMDTLDPQRLAAVPQLYRNRPRPAGPWQVGDPARAPYGRGPGEYSGRRDRPRPAAAGAAASRRVFVRRRVRRRMSQPSSATGCAPLPLSARMGSA